MSSLITCPICNREFGREAVEEHVNKCLFLNNTTNHNINLKRSSSHQETIADKRIKLDASIAVPIGKTNELQAISTNSTTSTTENNVKESNTLKVPLPELMRPVNLDDIVGHKDIFGHGSLMRGMLEQKKVPNMILYGPPGCGKTSLANVIAKICKDQSNMRFIKLSATMAGINDVKDVVKVAKNEMQFKRQTILFMDEIHRFNKLQQDTFLPHVESGTITLIGATTENPSFSLNNALLSRCRVIVMEKLSVDDVLLILLKAVKSCGAVIVDTQESFNTETKALNNKSKLVMRVEKASLQWLAEVCDGDARVALSALELSLVAFNTSASSLLSLENIKDGIKRSHMLYDRKGEEHYNTISALQKSIRASDDNAALYWTTRALHAGEDPLYIARRLVRTACEDVGLGDQNAIVEAVACLHGCQHIGMPECDVLLAQCAVRLARAPKSREVYDAMKRCQRSLTEAKGPLPPVPLHLRNAPTKLMSQLGYGRGYNLRNKEESGLTYMPDGMENIAFLNTDKME